MAPSPDASDAPSRPPGWLVVLPFVLALAAQAGALGGGHVLDDVPVVRENPVLERGAAGVGRVLRDPAWPGEQEAGPWRPLTLASLGVDVSLFGAPRSASLPQGTRLVNALLHALAAALLFSLLTALLPGRPLLALVASLLFAVHPLAAHAVGPSVGRADLLGGLCALGMLRLWWAYAPGRPASLPLAAVLLLLALLSKEAFVGLPLVALLLDRGLRAPSLLQALRARAPGYALLGLVLGAWAVLWPGAGASPAAGSGAAGSPDLLLGLEGLGRAALAAVLPGSMLADRSSEALAGQGFVVAGAALALALLGAAALLAALVLPWRGPRARLLRGVLLTLGALGLPAALTLPPGALLEPRAAYLLLPALAVGLGLLGEALGGALPRRGAALPVWLGGTVLVAVLAGLGALSYAEAHALHDDVALHEHLLAREPEHGRAMLRLARRFTRTAERERAEAAAVPSTSPAYAQHLEAAARARAQALDWVARAVRLPSLREDPEAWLTLGWAQLEADDLEQAERALRQARRLEPLLAEGGPAPAAARDPAAWTRAARLYAGLGRVQAARGQRALAANDLEQAERLEREAARLGGRALDHALLLSAAVAFTKDGRYGAALPLLRDVAQGAPDPALRQQATALLQRAQRDAQELLGALLHEAAEHYANGAFRAAVEAYEEALRAVPESLEARLQAATLRGRHFGNYALARSYVERGLALLGGRRDEAAETARARLTALLADLERWAREDDAEAQDEAR